MQFTQKKFFFPALALGVIVLGLAVINQQSPPLKPSAQRSTLVRVEQVQKALIAPEISGFGRVSPKVNWKAVAEVSGKVVYRHPDLEKGRILPAGTLIMEIDPRDYELALARAKADLSSSKAELAKMNLEEESLEASLVIEQQRLELSQKELERKEDLFKKGILARSDLDQERISYLAQKSQTVSQQNQLAVIPDSRRINEARVSINEARVDEARRQLANTRIVLPVAARVASVDAELGQAVGNQQQLAELHGIEVMEVEAQVALHDMKTLINSVGAIPPEFSDITRLRVERLGLGASLLISSADYSYKTSATLARISETIDPNQGTVGVILEARQDYEALIEKRQTPLVNGLFVEARLQGLEQQHLTVPEGALHGNTLYLLDDEKRLKMVTVRVLFRRGNAAAVSGDIRAGELLVTNDLVPAIPGMQLRYAEDDPAGTIRRGEEQ
ncbi:MAG: efflux RND transporter periplasmic adaptor subunit [Endozoicomonas sp.]